MAWPLPTALVLASAAAGTGLVLRRSSGATALARRWRTPGARPAPASGAGRG